MVGLNTDFFTLVDTCQFDNYYHQGMCRLKAYRNENIIACIEENVG